MNVNDAANQFYKALEDAGHVLRLDSNGRVDFFVMDSGPHIGPGCTRCGLCWCEHCKGVISPCDPRKQAAEAAAEGILPFNTSNPEGWQKTVDNNSDGYGACGVRFAARWANYMERELATGAKLSDVADKASHEADKEGITGFMYGCAVSILSQVWTHGEELRRWHNLKTQIGSEGEKANESGGTLNPALLTIG